MDLLGQVAGLAEGAARLPWEGPGIRILEHRAHAPGHAALLVEKCGVLVAGDMLSDVLVPMLDLDSPGDPLEEYLAALGLFDSVADAVDVVIPGHGSVGGADQLRARLFRDRAYVQALRDAQVPDDPRLGPSARPGWEWVSDVHEGQSMRRGERRREGRGLGPASALTITGSEASGWPKCRVTSLFS